MEKFKKILFQVPEYYLILVVLGTWYPFRSIVNPVAWVLIAILLLQLIYKNKIVGFLIGGAFLLVNLFMILALVSEFREFPRVNAKALQLLGVGLSIIALHVALAMIIISRSLPTNERSPMA